jgi:hypothetical protein
MNLEHELREALKRKNPSAGFDERVLGRLNAGAAGRTPAPAPRRWPRVALPLAASLSIAIAGSYYIRQQQETRHLARTERAAHDVVLALQIASEKVSAVQVKMREITHHERQVE